MKKYLLFTLAIAFLILGVSCTQNVVDTIIDSMDGMSHNIYGIGPSLDEANDAINTIDEIVVVGDDGQLDKDEINNYISNPDEVQRTVDKMDLAGNSSASKEKLIEQLDKPIFDEDIPLEQKEQKNRELKGVFEKKLNSDQNGVIKDLENSFAQLGISIVCPEIKIPETPIKADMVAIVTISHIAEQAKQLAENKDNPEVREKAFEEAVKAIQILRNISTSGSFLDEVINQFDYENIINGFSRNTRSIDTSEFEGIIPVVNSMIKSLGPILVDENNMIIQDKFNSFMISQKTKMISFDVAASALNNGVFNHNNLPDSWNNIYSNAQHNGEFKIQSLADYVISVVFGKTDKIVQELYPNKDFSDLLQEIISQNPKMLHEGIVFGESLNVLEGGILENLIGYYKTHRDEFVSIMWPQIRTALVIIADFDVPLMNYVVENLL